jgi:hypothetical protein
MPNLDDFYRHGELSEYTPGVSADQSWDEDNAAVCAEAKCPQCETVGLKYLPFYKAGALGRSFAECPHCNYVYEF